MFYIFPIYGNVCGWAGNAVNVVIPGWFSSAQWLNVHSVTSQVNICRLSERMQSWRKWFEIILVVQSVTLECESSAVCPHPGVPVHGFGVVLGDDRPILPIRQFSVGESLNFFCSKDRRIPSNQKATITCQSDGTWNGTIPRCGTQSIWTLFHVKTSILEQ